MAAAMQNTGITPDEADAKRPHDPKAAAMSSAAATAMANADKERKIGHRRVNENGEVSYKKVTTNQLMGSIQLGIGHAIGTLNKYDDRDLLMQDFLTVETTHFPRNGSSQTPAHTYSEYTFRTYAPLAFRYFLNLFGIQRDDFLVSLCSQAMRELSNPGASGSIFYLTYDDEFILKTVQHKEAEFLQKLLPGYYMNLNQNPHTLLPKFFGMYMYQCNQKNIRISVMNNLLPSNIKMHLKFDLKGSTFKRKANKHERAKSSPTFKDLDFMDLLPEGLMLEAETYNALITTMRRDCRVLESFRIMDYSLLIGIHNLDLAAKEEAESSGGVSPTREQARREAERKMQRYANKQKLVNRSTPMESIQAQTEPIDEQDHLPPGGIPARNHKGERLLLYLGIIDILQSYRMRKKLEHTFKAIIHDADTVSVHRPGFYAHRFLDFMADKVFKKIPSLDLPEVTGTHRKFRSIVSSLIALKHSPSKRGKRESLRKPGLVEGQEQPSSGAASIDIPGAASTSSQGNELGQLRGAAAIGAVAKTLIRQQQSPTIQSRSLVEKEVAEATESVSEAKTVAFALDTATANDKAESPTVLNNLETLNIPAVLWDRPVGSSKRVPPPVPPRSPRRPIDHVASFAAATANEAAYLMRGSARPDVVPGSSTLYDDHANAGDQAATNEVASSKYGGKPKHKRQDELQHASYNHSSFGSLHDSEYEQSPNHATPSHLSIGTSSLNTWTEGTPSYTESTMSGSLGRASADHPGRMSKFDGSISNHGGNSSSLGSRINFASSSSTPLRKSQFQSSPIHQYHHHTSDGYGEKRIETCSYQETEM